MSHFELRCSHKEYENFSGLEHQKFVSGSCYTTIVMWHGLFCSITPGCRSRMRTCGGQASLWQGDYRTTWRHLMFLLRNDTDHFYTVYMVKARQVAKYKVSGQESVSLPRGRGKSIRERPGEEHLSRKDNKHFWKIIQTSYNYIERW